jgi:23S rRNA (adenine2030-N6)-methyltransferase
MFSYQHRYHAGGFADVHKHICLIALLEALQQKPTPFGVMDAYAGEGIYDLTSPEAKKIKEYETGFLPLVKTKAKVKSPLLARYLTEIQKINIDNGIKYYPGSAAIIRSFLREKDSAIFIEQHPQAIQCLRERFKKDPSIHTHERDAIEAMIALTPFREKRGLIFVDPSYEVKKEYQTIAVTTQKVLQKFSNAMIAIWYPILPQGYHLNMIKKLKSLDKEYVIHEWSPSKRSPNQALLASGMLFINPPWKLESQLVDVFKEISSICA